MRVSKGVNLADKNILKSDKFINKSRILDKKYALLNDQDIMLAGTPYPAMDKDGGGVIPRDRNLIREIDYDTVLNDFSDNRVVKWESYAAYADGSKFLDVRASMQLTDGISADLSWYGDAFYYVQEFRDIAESFYYPEIPDDLISADGEYQDNGLIYLLQKKFTFKLVRPFTKNELEDNKLILDFFASNVFSSFSFVTQITLGSSKGSVNTDKFKKNFMKKKNEDELQVIQKSSDYGDMRRYSLIFDLEGVKDDEILDYVSVSFGNPYTKGKLPAISSISMGDPELRIHTDSKPIPIDEISPDSVEGITFEDVDFSVYAKKSGALMISGSVNEDKLPLQISDSCKSAMKNINFLKGV